MTAKELIKYMNSPELLNKHTLPEIKELSKTYPYFQSAALLYLKNLKATDDLMYQSELKRIALLVPDRRRLEEVMESKSVKQSVINENVEIPDDTENDNAPKLRHSDLIDSFISKNPHISPVGEVSDEFNITEISDNENVTDSIFTESLAKVYIKQKQYSKAIRIFEKLNLKYPEKSSYFAEQIENLNKLIENN
ncbi:MAG: hypothetical protein MJ003_02505 [Paludibacteraceae bacterium]|nr:hypothetical protein [Paludibacteraceae bacterium]